MYSICLSFVFIPIFSFSLLNFSYSLLTKQKSLPSLLRDERPIICLTRYHSFSWRNSMHSSDTRQQSLSLYPARITAGNPSASTFFIKKIWGSRSEVSSALFFRCLPPTGSSLCSGKNVLFLFFAFSSINLQLLYHLKGKMSRG